MTMKNTELADCVGNGARALDQINPHWFRLVDKTKLDMWLPDNCMYKQLFGGYNGLPKLFKSDPADYGFWPHNPTNKKTDVYTLLEFHWLMQINHRLYHA